MADTEEPTFLCLGHAPILVRAMDAIASGTGYSKEDAEVLRKAFRAAKEAAQQRVEDGRH